MSCLVIGGLIDHADSRSLYPSTCKLFKKFQFKTRRRIGIIMMLSKIFLDFMLDFWYNSSMKNEIALKMSPEGLEVANSYLQLGNITEVCQELALDENTVSEYLNKREIKQYIDQVYLDTGYRNRFKIATTLDNIIEEKLSEAEESQIYTNKDLADLLQMAHKMRMDELKAIVELEKSKNSPIKQQANIQINELPFGQGNYGKLMEKLLTEEKEVND